MKSSKWLLTTAAITGTLLTGISAQAKAALKIKVNPVKTGHYLSGKATPSSTIKVTRYGKLVAKGATNKKGTFKLKAKVTFHQNWKYKVVAAKHGYSDKSLHIRVKSSGKSQRSDIQALQNQVKDLNDQLSALNNTQNATNNANANYQAQINDLQQEEANLKNQLNTVSNSSSQASQTVDNSNYQTQINALNNRIADLVTQISGINTSNNGSNNGANTNNGQDTKTQQKIVALQKQLQDVNTQM